MYVSKHPTYICDLNGRNLTHVYATENFYPNLYFLNFLTIRHQECMKIFFLDLLIFVMNNLINLCDIKVVYHVPPRYCPFPFLQRYCWLEENVMVSFLGQ
ncbi:unnamed protein product [Pipistrellus nathusii]|uniref:Uncharacterized protein n=1 Tax=Pipistrellus nathusii TaxID=59473 RepID=A0ABN9ZE77_PIPNA